jgi:hypothetical protein
MAYRDVALAVNQFELLKGNHCPSAQFSHSSIPIELRLKYPQEIMTACHHPLLCEISRSKGKKPSHTCARPSHLIFKPKKVNDAHKSLQGIFKDLNITCASKLEARKSIIKHERVVAKINQLNS